MQRNAEHVVAPDGRQYHIGAAPGDVARHVLLVGDPARAQRAAQRFSRIDKALSHRDYHVYSGLHEGLSVSAMCVGMGAGCMEIAMVELAEIVDRPVLVRAGSSSALQPTIAVGDLVITQGALRLESASLAYVDAGFPAYAHAEVQIALTRAADELGLPHHLGVTATAAGFYGAQGRVVAGFQPLDPDLLARLTRQGVKNLEMETSCLLTLAALSEVRAGAVCSVFGTRHDGAFISPAAQEQAEEDLVSVGLRALHHLARMEDERGERPHWHDGLSARTGG